MKNTFLFLLLLLAINTFGQVQFAGFDRTSCADTMNNVYTYTNYAYGSGGSGTIYGYKIFKNGVLVYDASGTMSNAKTCKDLIFINDSTGFLVYYSGNTGNRMLKTADAGLNWVDIGGGAPNYFGAYIINQHFAYLVTQWGTPLQLYVSKCTDIAMYQNFTLIADTSITSDLFVTDTILDGDLCHSDTLDINVVNNTDTITYHINYFLLPTGINEHNQRLSTEHSSELFPNPCNNFFKITSIYDVSSVCLYSTEGRVIRNYDKSSSDNNFFSLANIQSGMYILRIMRGNSCSFKKILVYNHGD